MVKLPSVLLRGVELLKSPNRTHIECAVLNADDVAFGSPIVEVEGPRVVEVVLRTTPIVEIPRNIYFF